MVIAILLIVLFCSGRSFSFPPYLVLSSFDLMIMFSIMFGFVCVCVCVCVYCRFDSHEVLLHNIVLSC